MVSVAYKNRTRERSRGQVIDLFTKKSMTCPSDLEGIFDVTMCNSDSLPPTVGGGSVTGQTITNNINWARIL